MTSSHPELDSNLSLPVSRTDEIRCLWRNAVYGDRIYLYISGRNDTFYARWRPARMVNPKVPLVPHRSHPHTCTFTSRVTWGKLTARCKPFILGIILTFASLAVYRYILIWFIWLMCVTPYISLIHTTHARRRTFKLQLPVLKFYLFPDPILTLVLPLLMGTLLGIGLPTHVCSCHTSSIIGKPYGKS